MCRKRNYLGHDGADPCALGVFSLVSPWKSGQRPSPILGTLSIDPAWIQRAEAWAVSTVLNQARWEGLLIPIPVLRAPVYWLVFYFLKASPGHIVFCSGLTCR